MNNFFMIMRCYVSRLCRDVKEVALLTVIPIGLTIINGLFEAPIVLYDYNVLTSINMPSLLLAFQFFNMGIMLYFLYKDFRGDMRWRLRAAPVSLFSFILPAFVANWIFSIMLGIVIILISVLFLNAYLGNLLVFAAVLLIVSLMATFLSMLIFLFTRTYRAANGLVYVISFGLMILSGFMVPVGDSAVMRFFATSGTPLSLGQRAIIYSGAINDVLPAGGRGMEQSLINIGILAAVTLVIAVVTIITARRREI